ncbi:MAG: N-acetylneuraminate synthase [Candidatus Margulisiibacteriota bacterium]
MQSKIFSRLFDEEQPVFVIAEAGVNHNGSLELAKKLVDAAKSVGADAVKFQTFCAEEMVCKNARKADYQKKNDLKNETQFEMLKKLELKPIDFKLLAQYCAKKRLAFLSSPFDHKSVDLLESLKMPVYKIASGEITNFPLLEYIGKKRKPVILSTGMATLKEIRDAVALLKRTGTKKIALLHCITSYPARDEVLNLKAIQTLKKKFALPVGFSDHSQGTVAAAAAVALGAGVIEKHFTLDNFMPGPDHRASLDPQAMTKMVKNIRTIEKALGDGKKIPSSEEKVIKKLARKSLVASKNIARGEKISLAMVTSKRPQGGISPVYYKKVVGRRARQDISKDSIIHWKMLSKV